MVKFSAVQLPPPSSSSPLFKTGLGNQTPSSTATPKNRREPTSWTNSDEEATLVHLMVKEVHKGNKKKTFSQKAWENIEQGFYEKTGKKNILSQLKNKFSTLKSRYSDFNKLLKEPGFSWNPATGHAIATYADWEECIKANKRAKVFQKKGCPFYNELGMIYGNHPVAGAGWENTTPPGQCSLDIELKCDAAENESTKSSQSNPAKDSSLDREEGPYDALLGVFTGGFRQHSFPSLVDQMKSVTDAAAVTTMPTPTPIAGVQSKELDQLPLPYATLKTEVSGPKSPNSSHDEPKSFSITSCVKCLESIQGIDSRTYVKAVKLFKDVDWREMFMAMSAERRIDWLTSLE